MFHLIPYWNTVLRTFCCNYNLILVWMFFSFSICFFSLSLSFFLDSFLSLFFVRRTCLICIFVFFLLLSFSFTLFPEVPLSYLCFGSITYKICVAAAGIVPIISIDQLEYCFHFHLHSHLQALNCVLL